jgi:transposase InsO family protein
MCRIFKVSRSGVYDWLSRPESARQPADRRLEEDIKPSFEDSRQTYGTRRIRHDLRKQGQPVSRARIGRPMRQQGLRGKIRRRLRAATTSNHTLPVAPNHLNRQFQGAEPDRASVGDITCVATGEGWLYGAVFLDVFSRQVVGWALPAWMTADRVIDALLAPSSRPGLAGAYRSRQPIRLRPLPGAAEGPRLRLQHESQRQRLG